MSLFMLITKLALRALGKRETFCEEMGEGSDEDFKAK